jgi:long-subunit fatty acid transport protein
VALLCASVGASTASAQVDYEIMASLQFNFSNPGARSLAMAGALTGAGDDATGAWTNPGGLTNITRPEVGVEFRGFDFTTPFVSGGRFNGNLTQRGVDTINGLVKGESSDQTHSLSFVSAVVPRSRFAFAFYRTEVANFETNISTDGAFYDDPTEGIQRIFPLDGSLDVQIANVGGSVAVRLTDQVSVGVGLSVYDFNLDSTSYRYGAFGNLNSTGAGGFVGPALRDRRFFTTGGNTVSLETINGEDTAFGVNVGVSISPSDKVRLGASYRQGPKFDIHYRRETLNTNTLQNVVRNDDDSLFRLPTVIGVGALVKPVDSLNVTVDFRRVMYSQLTSDMATGFGGDPADYGIEDGNEFRVAGEYLFTNLPSPLSAFAIRGGLWHDPDHRIHYTGPFSADTVLYPSDDSSEIHVTGGAGIVFDKVQIDFGIDRADSVNTFSVSAVLRF